MGETTSHINDRNSALMDQMDDIHNIPLVDRVLHFLHMYPVETNEVTDKIEKVTKCKSLMTTYTHIPEVWIREVSLVFSDIIAVLMRITVQHANEDHEEFKNMAFKTRTELITPLIEFETGRHDWLRDHPQELEFVFNKMRLSGFSEVKQWGVTDGPQFRAIEEMDLVGRLVASDLRSKEEEWSEVIRLYGMFRNDFVDVVSVLQIYKDNDVFSIDLRRQLMHLYENIERGEYEETTRALLSPFLVEAAYKLWGWGDFVRQLPDGSTQRRDAVALQMTGAPASRADRLNGWYVETKEKHNGKATYKKTCMWKGSQHWIRYNSNKQWVVSTTRDVKENNMKALCMTTVHGDINPFKKQWKVYDADGEKLWKEYPDFKCEVLKAADLLWALDDCDVVINALPASEIQNLTSKCLEIRTEPKIIRHLEKVGHTLQRMLTAWNASTPAEPGQCTICMDRKTTEILLPCRHVCFCSICSKGKTECPFCKQAIDASCNLRVYATRTSHSPQKIFDVTAPMDQDASMNSLLLQLRDLHERV